MLLDAATLAAGEGIEGLVEDAILETKGMSDLRRLGVGSPPSGVRELLIELDVALHGTLLPRALGRRHLVFGLADARDDRVDAAHRDNAITGLHLWVTDVSVLCEVADGAVGRDGSGARRRPRDRPRLRGSASSTPAPLRRPDQCTCLYRHKLAWLTSSRAPIRNEKSWTLITLQE